MSKRTYYPDRGDLVEMNFQPAVGREIDKRRPGIIISPLEYNRRTGMCLVVPITSDLTAGALWVPMPEGYLPKPSLILCDYLRCFDYRERSAVFLAKLPGELVDQIVENLLDVVDPIK